MKIAYLVLAHGRPRQLARLIAALPTDAPVFIHFDRRADRGIYSEACELVRRANPSAVFTPRHRCRGGGPGIMYATLELIRAACTSGAEFEYATLLSGQDYPIKSEGAIERSLSAGGEY